MEFVPSGQGFLRKNLHGAMEYQSFVPTPLNEVVPLGLGSDTNRLLSTCSLKLGELKGMLRFISNADMYLAMYVRKEALLSAQIEGTQCTFDDVLDPTRTDLIGHEVADVVAYVRATELAVQRMKCLPLCMRLLREVHKKLLDGTRGAKKNPGEVRTSQNWVGPTGCTIKGAAYIPPNIEDMNAALSELERFINEADSVDPILKAALVHYQFETIHPFLDGNGRLGRLLITLSLLNDGVLTGAVFYPSYYLKLNRSEYYTRLMNVRQRGAYEEWVAFFCKCLIKSADDAIESLDRLVELRRCNLEKLGKATGVSVQNGQRLLNLLEASPFVSIGDVTEKLSIARTTASKLVEGFERFGILVQHETGRRRYRTFQYEEYLSILRQGSEPL